MKNNIINLGISAIGSGVGQSVINSVRLSNLNIKTFGFGTNALAYGLYECDEYIKSLSFYDPNYIADTIAKCIEHNIDIYIPGHDDDAHILSKNLDLFDQHGIKVIVAGHELLSICRDKERMSTNLNQISNIFVKSYNKQTFISALESNEIQYPVIAKPRGGYASRGIQIISSNNDLSKISDSDIIQELAIPGKTDPEHENYLSQLKKGINPQISEISIQLVADKDGEIMGKMISYNKLNNGIPIEILPFESEEIWIEIDKLYPAFKKLGLRGPFNLQGRLTDSGLKLFELNARFTGITGLRAFMGFNEVEACIKNWMNLDLTGYTLTINKDRFGIRQTADKSIAFERNNEVTEKLRLINNKTLKPKKIVLITGSTGYLGQNLITEIRNSYDDKFEVWAFVRDKKRAVQIVGNLKLYDQSDLKTGNLSIGNVDILVHAGFARPHCTAEEIADSVRFSTEILTQAFQNQVANIINISSQGVYGKTTPAPWTEESTISTESNYSASKYAIENLIVGYKKIYPHINCTSLRMGTITGGSNGLNTIDFLSKFVDTALKGENLKLVGGDQIMERIDIRDAVSGVLAFVENTAKNWEAAYNIGSGNQYTLKYFAELVCKNAAQHNGGISPQIEIENKITGIASGLDISKVKNLLDWNPKFSINDTIDTLFSHLNKKA